MPGTLIYLSNCAVDKAGRGNPFMLQELPWLFRHFDRIVAVGHGGLRTLLPEDIESGAPLLLTKPGAAGLRAVLKAPFVPDVWRELRRMRREHALTPVGVLKLLAFTVRGLKMHHWLEWALRGCEASRTTLYSCWMSYDAYAAALSKHRHPKVRFIARGHAFDVDVERNPMNPYLMKQRIAQEADGLYPISEATKAQLMQYMAGRIDERKVHVLAMGSAGTPVERIREAPRFKQGVLRVVSCAMVIPIKQVHVLLEALARWDGMPLCWTHIGGGERLDALRELADEKLDTKENVICDFPGTLDAAQIRQLYEQRAFDVFINTSRKEGVPVSIMEAMRFGVPAIAPRVGGIPELVTPEVGYLYDPQAGADGVLQALNDLAAQPQEESARMRSAAKARWDEHYCSEALLPKLFA